MPPDLSPSPSPAPAPPAEGEEPIEGHTIETEAGRKLVPLDYAVKLREDRRLAREAAAALTQRVAQWEQFGRQTQPILEALRRQQAETRAAPAPDRQGADPDLLALAKSLDLYDSAGAPDLERATTIRSLLSRAADTQIKERLDPVMATTARDRSELNRTRLGHYQAPNGQRVDPTILQAIWQLVPTELSANDQVAQVLLLAAAGYQNLFHPPAPVAPPEAEPLEIEAAGGRSPSVRLTALHTRIARDLGQSPSEFAQAIKTVADQGGVLE